MSRISNICASPFGAMYDFYIERPRLAQAIGRTVWGIDISPLYASMDAVGRLADGATVLDVPCGGGVALRAMGSRQRLRWIAADISERMLARCEARARERSLEGVELLPADMQALPLPDATADLCLSYSGLHMVGDPAGAVAEMARCLKPGGELIGTTFLSEGPLRQRVLFGLGRLSGVNGPCGTSRELRGWLEDAGVDDVEVSPDAGFALFRGRRR